MDFTRLAELWFRAAFKLLQHHFIHSKQSETTAIKTLPHLQPEPEAGSAEAPQSFPNKPWEKITPGVLSQAGARSGLKMLWASVFCKLLLSALTELFQAASRLLGALSTAKSLPRLFPGHFNPFSQHFQDALCQISQAPGIPCLHSHFSSWSLGLSAFFLGCDIHLPFILPFYQCTSYRTLHFRFPNQWKRPKIPESAPKMWGPWFHPVTAVGFKTWNAKL